MKLILIFSHMAKYFHERGGFWFPFVKWIIDLLYCYSSLGRLLNELFKRKSLGGPWVSEVYLLLNILIGLCWIAVIERPVLTAIGWIVLGLIVVFYRIFETLLFILHWLIVAEGPVESYRRSLLSFLINLFEIGIFFAIAYLLLDCFDPPQDAWSALSKSVCSVFSLKKMSGLCEVGWSKALALFQLCISWTLVVLILANVVGAINRNEKKDDSV